jgi:hypothetical protein
MGATVDFYDERPSNNLFVKAAIRYFPLLVRPLVAKYYRNIAAEVGGRTYNYILIINMETMRKIITRRLRRGFPEAEMILVLWDPLYYKPRAKQVLKRFDRVFSFDEGDCRQNRHIRFLPDFYLEEYANAARVKEYKYDVGFVGTAHTDRYRTLRKIKKVLEKDNMKLCVKLYFYSVFNYYLCRLFHWDFVGAKRKDFVFSPMTAAEIADIYGSSRIVIDIESPHQQGITMRTIEILAARRKMITTNANVRNYDFYNENNILIISKENPIIPSAFLTSPYEELSEEIYEKYSLNSWLKQILM